MKKCLALLTVILAVTGAGGQSIPASQSRVAGRFVAYNYGLWNTYPASISPATGSQTFTVINSYVNLGDGRLISPFSTNAPLRIGTETVTPSAVANCFVNDVRLGVCQLTVTFALSHTNSDKISSATFGLQEALNDAGNSGGGPVTVDSAWAGAGGTTAMVSAAIIPAGASIEDVRNGTTTGSGTVAGQASGVIPLGTAATTIGAQSHLDDGVTTPSMVTSSLPVAAPSTRAGTYPEADIVKYGAVIDGATPIDTALTSAFATACSTGGKVLLSCAGNGGGSGCYLANGSLLSKPCSGAQVPEIDLRGQLVLGSTLVLNNVALKGYGGGNTGSFHYAGPTAGVTAPQARGTVGGSVAAGANVVITPTFTLGSMANFNVSSVISVAGTSTCDISSITSLANTVTIVTAQSCRFNPGTGLTVAGVTDSSFNGTFLDYTAYPTIPSATSGTYTFHLVGANRSSSGGTVAGLNSDSFEEDRVCAVNSGAGTVTLCNVIRAHSSSDLWGMGAIATPPINGQLAIENIAIYNNWGVGLFIDKPSFFVNNVYDNCQNVITCIPADIEAGYGTVKNSTFFSGANQSVVGGYPQGLRLTQPAASTDSFAFLDFDNVEIIGGVFITCQGITSPPCKIGDVKFHNHTIFEQMTQAGVIFDPRNLATTYPVKFDNAVLQDELSGQAGACLIDATDATIPGVSAFTSFGAQIVNQRSDADGCIRGPAYKGGLTILGIDYSNRTPSLPLTGGTNAVGSIIAGKQAVIDSRDGGVAPAVQVYPYGSLNVNQNIGTWSNNGCTVTTGISDPQGGTQAANIFSAPGNGWQKAFTGNTVTTAAGDWFIYGAWFNGGTLGGSRVQVYSATDSIDGNAVGLSSRDGRVFEQQFVNDWWHPVIAIAQVTTGNASVHTVAVQMGCANGTGSTVAYPFIVQIPGSVSSTEVERIRQTMYHGITPPAAIANQASSALPINLPADPTTSTQAATKNYVDAHASVPNPAYAPGDLICAQGGDITIGTQTITAGSSTVSTITVTVAAVPNYMYAGQLITVNGATPSGYNVVSAAIVSTTSTTITYTSANNPAAWSSGGTIALACSNATDALIGTPATFANKYSVPANTIVAGSTFKVSAQLGEFASATAAGTTFTLRYNSTSLFTNGSGAVTPNGNIGRSGSISWDIVAYSPSLLAASLNSMTYPNNAVPPTNTIISPVPVVTTSTVPLQLTSYFNATGVASGTYTSGGSITGTVGQTCSLASFNNSSTATATVALTGTNTIAGGTALVIVTRGNAATAAPTTATLSSGTATCSGTATLATVLGGAPGNATLMFWFVERP